MKNFIVCFSIAVLTACSSPETKKEPVTATGFINETVVKAAVDTVKTASPSADLSLLEKGVKHAATLWRATDGTQSDFTGFVKNNYISDPSKRKTIFTKISR
jgi:hypothetical protein